MQIQELNLFLIGGVQHRGVLLFQCVEALLRVGLLLRVGRAADATLARGLTARADFVAAAADRAADLTADLTAACERFGAGASDDFFTAFLATEAVTPFAPNVLLGLGLPLIASARYRAWQG